MEGAVQWDARMQRPPPTDERFPASEDRTCTLNKNQNYNHRKKERLSTVYLRLVRPLAVLDSPGRTRKR